MSRSFFYSANLVAGDRFGTYVSYVGDGALVVQTGVDKVFYLQEGDLEFT